MSHRAVRAGVVCSALAVCLVGAMALAADDSHVYNSMKIRLHGDVATVEITQPWVTDVAGLKDKTVDIALMLTGHDDEIRTVKVFSSASGSPNAKTTLSVKHVERFRAGDLKRDGLLKKVTVEPLPARKGKNRRWSA